jgi:hypothetical protein
VHGATDYSIPFQQPIYYFIFISLPKTKKEKSYLFTTILPTFQTEFAKLEKNFNVGRLQKFICLPSLSPSHTTTF